LLTTQYRSIPSVGEVFSQFAYGGVLHHARAEDSQKRTHIDDIFEITPLNIIKFPVSKYEGIYRAKRLVTTPYHVYSALLVYEFTRFLAEKISAANPYDVYSVGVVSPYRAQADLIDRLLSRLKLPTNVSVQSDTIHGFQGDECNMIIAVFNPPPTISKNEHMFLNKLNIINVSISRARDCLFVLMPDDETDHIERLKCVNDVERIIKDGSNYQEFRADEIEQLMFGRTGYIEENTFSTSHQNVNVYGLPEKRYEVRSEDSAIDVQIHNEH
jgi:superfamily I DNA and/or RNA helicase